MNPPPPISLAIMQFQWYKTASDNTDIESYLVGGAPMTFIRTRSMETRPRVCLAKLSNDMGTGSRNCPAD